MFIYSVRSSSIKFIAFVVITLALLITAVILGEGDYILASGSGEINYSGVRDNESRVAFIESFGIDVDSEPLEEDSFTMPDNFDRVILGYNELQKKQGLDLSKYAKKRVTRYTYRVTNYDSEGEVYANLFIYRGKVIACDISSASPEGFIQPLTLVDREKLK